MSLLLALLLAACTVGPDYRSPSGSFLDRWFSAPEETITQDAIQTDWWTVFGDPQLERYIRDAAAHNNTLKASQATVLQARALRREAAASFFPVIGAEGGHTRQNTGSGASGVYDSGFDASWEIDIFGGTRRAEEAASARLQKADDQKRGVLLAVLAEVARNYYEVRGVQKRIAVTQKNIALQEQTLKLVDSRNRLGEASAFDLNRARGQFQVTQSLLPDLNADMKAGIYRLSILLGQPPEALLGEMTQTRPLPAPPDVVPVGLRSDILRRRPDVRAAERDLAAHTADIGAATAELFPQFFLTGSAGRSASVFSDLFLPAGNVFSVAQIFQWPIFEGGAIRARIRAEEAEEMRAAALYEQTVLEALADAETALTRYAGTLETRNLLQDAYESRESAVKLARLLFDSGEEDFLAVLDAERELASVENDLASSETDSVLNLVALYTALGGGWEVFEWREEGSAE